MQYSVIGENWSILFFPEGERTETGEIKPFQLGIGLLAGRLGVPIVPIRLRGVEKILHRHARRPRPGSIEITFGAPMQFKGEDYAAFAKQIEEAVRAL